MLKMFKPTPPPSQQARDLRVAREWEYLRAAEDLRAAARQKLRPSRQLQLKPSPFTDALGKTLWRVEYGEIIECGDCPEAACAAFDRVWLGLEPASE